MQDGKPRIDVKIGGANIFIAESPGHNAPPEIPYRGLEHFGLLVSGIDAVAAELKAKGCEFTKESPPCARACASASSAGRRASRSSCSSASHGVSVGIAARAWRTLEASRRSLHRHRRGRCESRTRTEAGRLAPR